MWNEELAEQDFTEKEKSQLAALLSDNSPLASTPDSSLGLTVGMREAFPDYHRNLLVVNGLIERLAAFVGGMSGKKQEVAWQYAYWQGMPPIRDTLTILSFGRIPKRVMILIDSPSYMRKVFSGGLKGAIAKNHLRRAIADYIVAPACARLLERATERPFVPMRETVERVVLD